MKKILIIVIGLIIITFILSPVIHLLRVEKHKRYIEMRENYIECLYENDLNNLKGCFDKVVK